MTAAGEALLRQEREFKAGGYDGDARGAATEASFAAVKATIGCDQVASREPDCGGTMRAEGDNLRANCPLPSCSGGGRPFYCYGEGGLYFSWHCFRCGGHGDVVDLHDAMHGPFPNPVVALHDLADKEGVRLWREEDLLSDEQQRIRRARRQAEAAVKRALVEHYFELWAVPALRAVKDPALRERLTRKALKTAGLA